MNMKFDTTHLCGLKFSTAVNSNVNIINIQKYRHIMAVYLISCIQRGNGTDTVSTLCVLFWCISYKSICDYITHNIQQVMEMVTGINKQDVLP